MLKHCDPVRALEDVVRRAQARGGNHATAPAIQVSSQIHTDLVAKSNLLVDAHFRLTLAEQRLLLCVLAKLNSHSEAKPPPSCNMTYIVTADQLAAMFDIPRKQAYELLRDAVSKLGERWVTIDTPDPDTGLTYTRTRWVSAVDYYRHRGQVGLCIATKILPFVTQLAREFTSYRIRFVSQMTSAYALRLYEMLSKWRSAGQATISLEWLREHLCLDNEPSYQRVDVLRREIVNPAVAQINAHSDLSVSMSQVKEGRRVVAIAFSIAPRSNPKP